MSVVLIAPPMVRACEPLLGIATLKAFLEVNGVRCDCIDANAHAQEWLLDADRLDGQVERLTRTRGASAMALSRARSWPTLRRQVGVLKAQLRTPEGYATANRYRTTATCLNRVMNIAGLCHGVEAGSPIRASLSNYEDLRFSDMDSAQLAEGAAQPELNLFYDYFRELLLPELVARRPAIIGLSFIFRSQLLCGLVLARMIREALPEALVVIGGELISAWVDVLEQTHLPTLADAILPYEGELGLLALARAIAQEDHAEARPADRDARLASVPNLIWTDAGGRLRRNPTRKVQALSELPPPDYSWAPWDLYLAPVRTAAMVTARGCYWNRCTFCPEVINPETLLRVADVDRLTADMDDLHDRWGVAHFHFIDSALPPRTLKGIARHIIDRQRPYTWYGFSRLERTLAIPGTAELLGRGGCRMLKLGLETGSQRLLDGMDKRQELDVVSRILRALRDARVMVHAFLMFGTPREEFEDAEMTRQFIAAHHDCVQFVNCSIMNLAHGSPMALDPPSHGILSVQPFAIEGRALDLALYSNFEGVGWGRVEARRYLHKVFLKDPAVRPIHLRTPALFDSNHSAFFHPLVFGSPEEGLQDKTCKISQGISSEHGAPVGGDPSLKSDVERGQDLLPVGP